ncbi:MAG: AIM24 family protein [Alphaproteobacteria bacterium]|nr:AIM24 family protein [Alphaproteobacteria bacterium]
MNYEINGTIMQTLALTLSAGDVIYSQTNSMAWMSDGITMDTHTGGGGEGFILQKVTGPGMVWLDLSGELIERDLAPGERLLVHAGHVGVQDPSVEFDIQMVRGFKNILFGGEGLFLASLTGPGHVWLQSMPIMNLAEEIGRYLPERGEVNVSSPSGAAAIIGGVLGGMLSSGQSKSDQGTDV